MISRDLISEKGLPANVDAERFVLGAILLEDSQFVQVAGALEANDFSIEKHRKIFLRMLDLHDRGESIDRITLTNELIRQNQLEQVDGLNYIVSLDDGLPKIVNLESYVRIVKEKAVLRDLIAASQRTINQCLLGTDEPAEILAEAEESLLRLGEAGTKNELLSPSQILEQFDGGINSFLDPSKRVKGLGTPFSRFNEMTGGLHKGELFILAARPSMGKTALALNIAQHVACQQEKTVAVFSLEMSKESLLTRMLCAGAYVDQQRFRAGYLNQDERMKLSATASEMMRAPLYIDDTSGTNLMDIHSKLRRLKSQQGLDLVILDYLQLMNGGGKRYENRNQEVSALSRGLKLLAKELDVPIVVLSQLSRAPETRQGDHRPQMSDLRESGSIEQDADLVGFIFREEVYKPDREDLKGVAELIIAKQRNGPIGRVKLVFLRESTRFVDAADGGAGDDGE